MWIILREFQVQYNSLAKQAEHWNSDSPDRDSMMDETLEIIREAAVTETVPGKVVDNAAGLWQRWRILEMRYYSVDNSVPGSGIVDTGQLRTWSIFSELTGEIAGARPRYMASSRIPLTMRDLWKEEPDSRAHGGWINNPNETIGDNTGWGRALGRVMSIVTSVASTDEPDPAKVQIQHPAKTRRTGRLSPFNMIQKKKDK
jgi:hypothetical protein